MIPILAFHSHRFIGSAAAQSNFYQDKTITVIAGANAGSTYDLYVG